MNYKISLFLTTFLIIIPVIVFSATTFDTLTPVEDRNSNSFNDTNFADIESEEPDTGRRNDFRLDNPNYNPNTRSNLFQNQPVQFNRYNFGANGRTLSQILQSCNSGNCGYDEIFALTEALGRIAISFVTTVATVMFVYAGFLYITAQGDTNQIKRATGIFRNVAIGFVIILLSYILVKEFLIKIGAQALANLIT